MTHDPLERDATLEKAFRGVAGDSTDAGVDWIELRRAINQRAAAELKRRRARYRRLRVVIPATLAASFVLFLLTSRMPERTGGDAGNERPASTASSQSAIDELLDADISDGQFRALLFGATEADDLLLIAAEDRP
jgi:hypothetical protein